MQLKGKVAKPVQMMTSNAFLTERSSRNGPILAIAVPSDGSSIGVASIWIIASMSSQVVM